MRKLSRPVHCVSCSPCYYDSDLRLLMKFTKTENCETLSAAGLELEVSDHLVCALTAQQLEL